MVQLNFHCFSYKFHVIFVKLNEVYSNMLKHDIMIGMLQSNSCQAVSYSYFLVRKYQIFPLVPNLIMIQFYFPVSKFQIFLLVPSLIMIPGYIADYTPLSHLLLFPEGWINVLTSYLPIASYIIYISNLQYIILCKQSFYIKLHNCYDLLFIHMVCTYICAIEFLIVIPSCLHMMQLQQINYR